MSFDTLVNEAGDIRAGSEGLLFLPYLTGERTPYPDPLVRAAWVGLTVRHTRAHMTRAVLEGVAFGIKDSFTLIQNAGLGCIEQVRMSGGGAKSALWRQIMADVLGVELVTVNTTEGAAFGAALLAGVGAGVFESVLAACEATIQITGRTTPTAAAEKYQQIYPHYRALYPALKDEFQPTEQLSGYSDYQTTRPSDNMTKPILCLGILVADIVGRPVACCSGPGAAGAGGRDELAYRRLCDQCRPQRWRELGLPVEVIGKVGETRLVTSCSMRWQSAVLGPGASSAMPRSRHLGDDGHGCTGWGAAFCALHWRQRPPDTG